MQSEAAMSRELMGKIVDEVFDGAIEDVSVIEEIYAAIKRHEAALSTDAEPVGLEDEDRTPMPAGFDPVLWRKADEIHHAMALVARDQECVKIVYSALLSAVRHGVGEALQIATDQAGLMADLAIEGLPENAREREAMEAALTRFANNLSVTLEGLSIADHTSVYAEPVKTAPAEAVKVKPLEWSNVDDTWNDVWECVTDLAEGYSITRWWLDNRRDEIGHFEVEDLGEEQFGSLEEAQAAAQTHFTSRYAALSAQVQDVAGERSAEIRKAGINARDELLERLADGGSVDNDLADYLERIVDACVRAAAPAKQEGGHD